MLKTYVDLITPPISWSSCRRLDDETLHPESLLYEMHINYLLTLLTDPPQKNQDFSFPTSVIIEPPQKSMFSKPAAPSRGGVLESYSYHCVSNKLTITYHTAGYSDWGAAVVVEEGLVLLRQGEVEVLQPC